MMPEFGDKILLCQCCHQILRKCKKKFIQYALYLQLKSYRYISTEKKIGTLIAKVQNIKIPFLLVPK
jgi:hypothetical protein